MATSAYARSIPILLRDKCILEQPYDTEFFKCVSFQNAYLLFLIVQVNQLNLLVFGPGKYKTLIIPYRYIIIAFTFSILLRIVREIQFLTLLRTTNEDVLFNASILIGVNSFKSLLLFSILLSPSFKYTEHINVYNINIKKI